MKLPPISLRFKIGLGLLVSYGSFEVYMFLRSKYMIYQRKQEYVKTMDLTEADVSRFKSATIGGVFVNPFDEYRPQTAFEFLFVRVMELFESFYGNKFEIHDKYRDFIEGNTEVENVLRLFKPDLELLKSNSKILNECVSSNKFSPLFKSSKTDWFRFNALPAIRDQMIFTWIGQSCSLVQVSGINFLTDPLLSNHLFNDMLGPKRLIKAPMTMEDIKYATGNKLNFTLVSHDHPDHLDLHAAKELGNSTTWIVPLGLRAKLARMGIYKVIELDWWDSISLNEYIATSDKFPDKYELVCLPAMHWSGRYVIDSNKSLWCSYMLRRNGESILYHAGDTGYLKDLFDIIGKKYGPTYLSLLPIGQYCPSWHQKPRHISPEESLKICSQLSTTFMQGIHWGTFKLSGEPILEPKTTLQCLSALQNKTRYYRVPEFGLSYLYNLNNSTQIEELHKDIE
ncbi:uncharacterized protein PRCAT00000916001 [Priceomyces carsonii]|uniref:uncharacterized protein n=1 Tax=Priceomyces carsonii TaxID=28549 RepID=UPI002ED993F5|nr:unnamed protein product [Priceomyces carsonii]